MPPTPSVPAGLWAIGNELADVAAARHWARPLPEAACLTLRRPPSSDRAALAVARVLAANGTAVAIHARLDLALLLPTAGVIAGVHSLPAARLRALLPPPRLLGVSVHDQVEAQAAVAAGADYLLYGPVWGTPAKVGILDPRGTDALAAICAAVPCPVVAIGGILQGKQLEACRDAGAHAVAVLRAAQNASLWQELQAAWRSS